MARQYEYRQTSLTEIADKIGCSRGTIRNDLVRFLGEQRYARVLSSRRTNNALKGVNVSELRKLLTSHSKFSNNRGPTRRLLLDALTRAERHGISLLTILRAGGSMHFYLPDDRTVRIRTALAGGDQPEHRFGLHRFRISSGISRYDFAVFAISDGSTVTTYVFKPSEIASVQSLALRYKWFERTSRYDFARDRWSILKPPRKH